MIEKIKEALSKCKCDGNIYLIEGITDVSGFFMTDKHLLYMVCNFENDDHQSLETEYLLLNTNVDVLSIKNNQLFPSGKYNILKLLPVEGVYEKTTLESFVKLCFAHSNYMKAKSFVKFFYSLTAIFQMPKEQQYKNLVGFFGELSFIKYLCDNSDIDLSAFWHKGGSNDKYEFSLESFNIEVKTTSSIDEAITIKHTQLFNDDKNYLVVVCIEENNSGQTLNQLVTSMHNDSYHYNNYNFAVNIEREKRRVSLHDADNKKFSVKSISVYLADEINPFPSLPNNISRVNYSIDLIGASKIPEEEWKQIIMDDLS